MALARRSQFVGTKTLNSALRFLDTAVRKKATRALCAEHIQPILFELSLPLLLVTEHEHGLWAENPVEFVRLQVDNSNSFNVKRSNQSLIRNLTNIR
jgi:hypothetical protein